jgi:hypothetical protein
MSGGSTARGSAASTARSAYLTTYSGPITSSTSTEVGGSQRSPATPAMTARRSASYLAGDATPGMRARPSPDPFEPFDEYVTARLVEDPHLWARRLFDGLEGLGSGCRIRA